jgi:CheY-like chemotaxis protein
VTNSALRILVVDDYPDLANAIGVVVQRDGHRAVIARGGPEGLEALRAARSHGDPFDVVLTDFSMPERDGLRMAAAIKEASPSTFVVFDRTRDAA